MGPESASKRPRNAPERERSARRATAAILDEDAIRAAARAGDGERAATLALRALAEPIRRYLRRRLAHPSDAEEAFSDFSEALWLSLPQFRGDCSLRTWAFLVARSAASRQSQRRGSEARSQSGLAACLGTAEDSTATRSPSRMTPEDLLLTSESRELRVRELRSRLRPRDAAALRALIQHGGDVSATALRLNTSCNNVYQMRHRILRVASAL
jgi:RNA polymerase sigma-70 factor (ECF subfamily)